MLHLDLLLSWSETSYQNILANDDRSAFFQAIKREDKIVREIHPRLIKKFKTKWCGGLRYQSKQLFPVTCAMGLHFLEVGRSKDDNRQPV